jgi:hypothetical protein
MAVKELAYESDARAALLAGVEKLAAAVKSTLLLLTRVGAALR